ncbi:MAG TPA: protein kinase [Candidatus Acidoferrum sp.]|nr:protein kinase [Candidatus Acidoferrum sp.]
MNKLGKYEILAELGRGAMGVVYKARDPFIGRLVALKTITSGLAGKPQLLERFYQEARSAGTLQHPNIVTIFELGQEKDTPFIAMEFLEGDSLDKIVEGRPTLPLFQKLEYVVKVCEALDHAHRHGVIHRDVKPGNVMVTKDGAVKVVDFGIARLTDTSMTQANMMIGSRAYMSPQLYKGERADARSDIWALGVTLYELLAYRRPFLGESEAELMFNIITNGPPALRPLAPDCSEELERIVMKMLEKKAEDRYQTMEDVLHELEPLCKAAQQATVAGLMTDSKQLMEANDLPRAQGMLRKVLQIDVGNSTAKSMLEKVTAELRKSQVLPKIQEHVNRGRTLLEAGHLREARAEADAALGLDSRQDTALKFRAEVEEALTKAQQLEQQLRLSKQRLAEGAVTEAVGALDQALSLDAKNPQAQELKRQIEEEQRKREKRQKLAEILHRARSLWAELNYAECLEVIAAALKDFPNDPELMKLLESARHDQAEEQKRVRFAETRKLLGEQKFAEALKVADDLSKRYPRDATVESLRAMAQRGLQDQKRSEFLQQELAALRALVSAGKYGEATARVEPLLKEFPQEFTLMEIAAYAKGELAQQEQKQREDERQQQIRGLMEAGKYREAEDTAKRAVQEFPKLALFQQLYEEAQKGRKDQEERAEFQRRIQQIRGKINQGHLTDAADLCRQTLATMGPNADVAQLLHSAEVEITERKKKQSHQEQQIQAAKTMLDAGNFAGATQLLNQAIATQIFHPDDPRTQQLFAKIDEVEREASKKHTIPPVGPPKKPADKPAEVTSKFVATGVGQNVDTTAPATSMFSATQVLRPGESSTRLPGTEAKQPSKPASGTVSSVALADSGAARTAPAAGESGFAKVPAGQRAGQKNLLVLAGAGLAAVLVLAIGIWLWKSHSAASAAELKLKDEATQLWSQHQLDASEQAWRQLAEMHGKLQSEAAGQVRLIEEKRTEEKNRFDQGESLMRDQKDYADAQKTFQDVVRMNLWLVDDAKRELDSASALASGADIKQQEQDHFTKGQQFFEKGDYKQAAGEFDTVVNLNVPDSTIKPQAEEFLRRIRQSSTEKKLYDSAVSDVSAENWTAAQQELQDVIKRKGPLAADARKQLATVSSALKVVDNFSGALKSGSFPAARAELNAAHAWPKTQKTLSQQLHSAEIEELGSIRNQAQAIEAKGDVSAIEHLQDQLHGFMLGINDPSVKNSANELDKSLSASALKLRENKGDRAAFDSAVLNFNRAKEKGDVNELSHDVTREFQKIANSKSLYRDPAQEYVTKSIPNAILELTKTLGGKALVPPIQCRGNGSAGGSHSGDSAECGQLDSNSPLQWVGTPMVDFPDSAKKPGKLPYVLSVTVMVDNRGDVKIEKAGNVDNDFFKKAKDSAKHWKTTVPRSGGKAVSVKFPLSITFEKR